MHETRLPAPARPFDPRRIDEVPLLTAAEVVRELVDILGARLTAMIGDVTSTRHVRAWIDGQNPQRLDALKAALQAARVIADVEGRESARGWFTGCNTRFELRSPAEELLKNTPASRTKVLEAALGEVAH